VIIVIKQEVSFIKIHTHYKHSFAILEAPSGLVHWQHVLRPLEETSSSFTTALTPLPTCV